MCICVCGGGAVCIPSESICHPKLVTSGEWDGKEDDQGGNRESLLFVLILHASVLLKYFYNVYITL